MVAHKTSSALVKNYATELSEGNIKGRSQMNFGGRNDAVGTSEETLWTQGGIYVYLVEDTQLYISSTDTDDTAVNVVVIGLNEAGEQVVRSATTNGQNQVEISGLMWRVFAMQVVGTTAPLGDLYLAETDSLDAGKPEDPDTIKAKMIQGENVATNATYTVPAGKKLLLKRQRLTVSAGKSAKIAINVRLQGGLFTKVFYEVFEKAISFNYEYSSPPLPAFTDIEISCSGSASGTEISTSLDGELIDI